MAESSLWLVPNNPALTALRHMIHQCAHILGTPVFEPHLTLAGDIPMSTHTTASMLQQRQIPEQSLCLELTGIDGGDDPFMSLYLTPEIVPNHLLSLRSAILDQLGQTGRMSCTSGFTPHMSMAYGPLSADQRQRLMRLLHPLLPIHVTFNAISVVHASQTIPVTQWTTTQVLPFT